MYAIRVGKAAYAIKAVESRFSKSVKRELDALSRLKHNHPHIVHFIESQTHVDYTFMVFELAQCELCSCISPEGSFDEATARVVFGQMLAAVSHVHELGIVHRDIKLENWLVFCEKIVKLTDFGLAHIYADDTTELLTEKVGSKAYCMPDVIDGVPYRGHACDAWSLGVCLFAMVCGFLPYKRATTEDWRFDKLYDKSSCLVSDLHAHYNIHCSLSAGVCALVHGCIGGRTRLSVQNMRLHPWTCDVRPHSIRLSSYRAVVCSRSPLARGDDPDEQIDLSHPTDGSA